MEGRLIREDRDSYAMQKISFKMLGNVYLVVMKDEKYTIPEVINYCDLKKFSNYNANSYFNTQR